MTALEVVLARFLPVIKTNFNNILNLLTVAEL